jgi:hypothetical protein
MGDGPGLWTLTVTSSGSPPRVQRACFGDPAGPYRQKFRPNYKNYNDPGCLQSETQDGDKATITTTCPASSGHAASTTTMSSDASADKRQFHIHFEAQVAGGTDWRDTRAVYLGVCPVPVPVGQNVVLLDANGNVMPLTSRPAAP